MVHAHIVVVHTTLNRFRVASSKAETRVAQLNTANAKLKRLSHGGVGRKNSLNQRTDIHHRIDIQVYISSAQRSIT